MVFDSSKQNFAIHILVIASETQQSLQNNPHFTTLLIRNRFALKSLVKEHRWWLSLRVLKTPWKVLEGVSEAMAFTFFMKSSDYRQLSNFYHSLETESNNLIVIVSPSSERSAVWFVCREKENWYMFCLLSRPILYLIWRVLRKLRSWEDLPGVASSILPKKKKTKNSLTHYHVTVTPWSKMFSYHWSIICEQIRSREQVLDI